MPIMDDYDAGLQRGVKHGFNMALLAVRNVDKQIKYPETHGELGEIPWNEQNTIYNSQKDILYKIYEEIKFEMTKELK
jgi:hypothetical protein